MSEMDPWIIAQAFPRQKIHFWAKKELVSFPLRYREYRSKKKSPITALLFTVATLIVVRYSSVVPVDRANLSAKINKNAIRLSGKLIAGGGVIGIFGSGGIEHEGDAKAIFVKLAQKHHVPIVPIYVAQSHVIIGTLVPCKSLAMDYKKHRSTDEIAQSIMTTIQKLKFSVTH